MRRLTHRQPARRQPPDARGAFRYGLGAVALCGLVVPAPGASARPLTDGEIDRVQAEFASRRDAVLEAELRAPFPRPECRPEVTRNDPCVIGMLNRALAAFYLRRTSEELAMANADVREAVARISTVPGYRADFHFMTAAFLYRILRQFGPDGGVHAGLLDHDLKDAIAGLFWSWASTACRIEDFDPGQTWRIWKSENHGAQRDGACWAGAALLRAVPAYAERRYEDGSTPAEFHRAATEYLKSYLRERGRHGTLVEFFSPTYSQYTLLNFHMYYDFSEDAELRRLARFMLDLWWAMWAQEQVGGLHGGSKTRVYESRLAATEPMDGLAWLYFGLGRRTGSNKVPGVAAATTSSYQPPPVVVDIALDAAGRGTYDVFSRAPSGTLHAWERDWYRLDPEADGLLRRTHVAPGFAMGMALVPRRPARDWPGISSQNRWNGIVLAGDPEARIVPMPAVARGRSHYNATWGVQSGATQIVQRLPAPYSGSTGRMRVWFGRPLRRVERDDWVFVADGAYVAIRPAFDGYRWDPSEPRWMLPRNMRAPIILQAAPLEDFPDLAAFQAAVLQAPLTLRDGVLEFVGLDTAGRLTLHMDSGRLPEIDGVPVDLGADFVFRSPFLNADRGTGVVMIRKNDRQLVLDFN